MGSRKTIPGVENVYSAAENWVDCALRKDDSSLFTPGKPIWTKDLLGELRECYLDQPDVPGEDFYDKLRKQLEGRSPAVYQLMAEVLYVHFLIIWHGHGGMTGETKIDRIDRVLDWSDHYWSDHSSDQWIVIPDHLIAGLTPGIAAFGPGQSRRPFMVGFLIEFVDQWKTLEQSDHDRMLDDPWAFKNLVMGMKLDSLLLRQNQNTPWIQKEALLHLVHPDTFEGIVSFDHKEKIAGTKAFVHFVEERAKDVDRKLFQIRQGLEAGLGRDFDFYDSDIISWWDQSVSASQWTASSSDPWHKFLRIASEFLKSGELKDRELDYKYEIAGKLRIAREAVLSDAENWHILVKRGIIHNIIHSTQQDNFRRWIDESPENALMSLETIWAYDDSTVAERVQAFSSKYPKSVRSATGGAGTRLTVFSQLLMGVDVEEYPPFGTEAFKDAYNRTGYSEPAHYNEAALYEHALGFLDRFILEARARGVPVRHRLDAQALMWMIVRYPESLNPADYEGIPLPPTEDLAELAPKLHLPLGFLENIDSLLNDKKQVIFQGPPGTGKTYVAQKLAKHLAGSEDRVTLVQFHPSYAYEDFVRGFRPSLKDGQPGFELKDGPLLQAAERARQDEERDVEHFLIIDEINRGNLAKVFGELYFLLEYRDEAITLQYQRDGEEKFSLPSNLYIIGTMNTADRSIALVDLALRRRFYFVEFHPDDEPVKGVLRRWLSAKHPRMEWVADMVEEANNQLRDDRHAAIGPSYFMKKDGLNEADVERIWKHSVLPYIEERRFGGDKAEDFKLDKIKGSIKAGDGVEDVEDVVENQGGNPSDA